MSLYTIGGFVFDTGRKTYEPMNFVTFCYRFVLCVTYELVHRLYELWSVRDARPQTNSSFSIYNKTARLPKRR